MFTIKIPLRAASLQDVRNPGRNGGVRDPPRSLMRVGDGMYGLGSWEHIDANQERRRRRRIVFHDSYKFLIAGMYPAATTYFSLGCYGIQRATLIACISSRRLQQVDIFHANYFP